jgi:prevent-host-death family protein
MRAKTTISISEARKKIFDIAEEVQRPGVYYTFTEKGMPKVVLMSADEFNSLMENLEILSDPKVMTDIKKAEEEYKRGEYITWEEMKKELHQSRRPSLVLADKGKKKYLVRKIKK